MNEIKQSFSWWCFANRGLENRALLRTAKDIGYEGVELIEEALWPEVVDHGLRIVSVAGHESIDDGMNRPENARRIEAEIRAKIAQANKWNIPLLICFAGRRRQGVCGIDATAEILARLAPEATDAGVTLALELLNSKVDHTDYECDRTAWGIEVCRRVDSPAVKLLYDIYHMQIMEGDLIRTIAENHAFFAHYHTAGNPGRGFPGPGQEIQYPAVYRAIRETGYSGFIGHEFLPEGDLKAQLAQAFSACRDSLSGPT
jgi:hydroxypyruvate isomerase